MAIHDTLPAGESRAYTFILTWSFPNRIAGWEDAARPTGRNFYATRFADAWATAEYVTRELPRLLHDALRPRPRDQQYALRELLEAQHRTNRLLQSIIYGGLGFVLGLLVMQLFVRMRIF